MAAQPPCPYCGAKLFPHEVTNDQCASCGGRLSGAPNWTPPIMAEPTQGEVRPLQLNRTVALPNRPPPEAFATVRQGINLVRWGVSLMWGFGALALFCYVAGQIIEAQGFSQLLLAIGLFALMLQFVSVLAAIVGVCMCCSVPRGCEAARWVRYVVTCIAIAAASALIFASDIIRHASRSGYVGPVWLEVAGGCALLLLLGDGLVGLLCFCLLLAALARQLGEARLARGFINYFLVLLCAVFLGVGGGSVAFAVLLAVLPEAERNLSLVVLSFVSLLLIAVLTSWPLILLTRLHRLIPVPGEADPRREFQPQRWS